MNTVLCSNCFSDQGLRFDAESIGKAADFDCPNCGNRSGKKLAREQVATLAQRFFVWGTLCKCDYGAAPIVQFNEHQKTSIKTSLWLEKDIELIGKVLDVGFFLYGPPLWMIGEIEPLHALQNINSREKIVHRIIQEYPAVHLGEGNQFYRIRKAPINPDKLSEYDSPPTNFKCVGRLNSIDLPVMYASQYIEICVHECRVTAEDELYVATLAPTYLLNLLDISYLLTEEHVSPFESLDLAIHYLFLAGEHSYEICREIARAAHAAGYDGIIYPSYFSSLYTGIKLFESVYGLPCRLFPQMREHEQNKLIPNLALFGRPISDQKVLVRCINKLILSQVRYGFHFGPVCV